jgi:hypothetical protein
LLASVSFAATVALLLVVERLTGFDLFSLMWWVVVPVGAFATGLVAASGYYAGAVALDLKPGRAVAVAMPVLALLVWVALHYARYRMVTLADGQVVSGVISFPRFVGWTLSHTRYDLFVHGRGLAGNGGVEVGVLGYVVALLQLGALALGGLVVYLILADKTYCERCRRFLRRSLKLQLGFAGDLSAVTELRAEEALSRRYFERLRALPDGQTAALELELLACPGCAKEALVERPMLLRNGKLAYVGDAYRTSWSALGASLSSELGVLAARASAGRPPPR